MTNTTGSPPAPGTPPAGAPPSTAGRDSNPVSRLRALLILGRVSNLPTIWTNCLAAWLLGGGGNVGALLGFTAGATLAYIAGMYLNDAFDAEFDTENRQERPIPSGVIPESVAWVGGTALLLAGCLLMSIAAPRGLPWILLLSAAIVLYNAVHKTIPASPFIMAACRTFLFLAAATTGMDGLTGYAAWAALALGGWIVGLSYVARTESGGPDPLRFWPLLFLGLPCLLAGLGHNGQFRTAGIIGIVMLLLWTGFCLRHLFNGSRQAGQTVRGLLAGICLVDGLAALPDPPALALFGVAFIAALVAQRHIPAT